MFFLGRSKTLHFSSVWHYLVDLLVYLESSSFYKVHFWFWPRFMLKNSVIVESRTATCPLSETTKFSERFSVFMLFSQEDTIGQHKTCVLFFFFCPNHSLFDQCVHSALKSWSLPLYLLAKSNLWRFCFLDSKQNACYAGHICAICLIIDAWTLTHISSYRFCNEIWGFLETFFPPSGAFWLNLLNVYIW